MRWLSAILLVLMVSSSTGQDVVLQHRRKLFQPVSGAGISMTTDLAAWWHLDESSGIRECDSRIPSYSTLVLHNNPSCTVTNDSGKITNAVMFIDEDQVSSLKTTNDVSALNWTNQDFTIACWVNPVRIAAGVTQTIIEKGSAYNQPANINFRLELSNNVPYFMMSRSGLDTNNLAGVAITTNNWHMIIVWHDSTNDIAGMQIDDQVPLTNTYSGGGGSVVTNLFLGDSNFRSSREYYGRLDSLGIWRRVLTPSERSQFWNSSNAIASPWDL